MKKFLLSFLLILTFTTYVFHKRTENSIEANVIIPTQQPAIIQQVNPIPAPTAAVQQTSGYRDGQYQGNVADAFYGNIQVQITISQGKITDVQFLQYPNDRNNSIYINSQAMPYLKQEAIVAQSASVNIVSGATATSQAFQQSLQSALDKARI